MAAETFKNFTEECIDDICEGIDLYEDLELEEATYQGKTVTLNDPIRTGENPNKKLKCMLEDQKVT